MNRKFQCKWILEETFDINKKKSAFILYATDTYNNILRFNISIVIIDIKNNIAYQMVSSVPKEYFEGFELIKIENLMVRVPNKYKDYLIIQYGDWKTRVRGTSLDIYHHEDVN